MSRALALAVAKSDGLFIHREHRREILSIPEVARASSPGSRPFDTGKGSIDIALGVAEGRRPGPSRVCTRSSGRAEALPYRGKAGILHACLMTSKKKMTPKQMGDLLDRIECLKDPCDLDSLLFFFRHPRSFLIGERLAAYVGYDVAQVARSLETLIAAGVLRRSPDSTHPARLYVLTPGSTLGGWLSSLLRFATTREGRLAVIHALKQRQSSRPSAGDEPELWRGLEHFHGG